MWQVVTERMSLHVVLVLEAPLAYVLLVLVHTTPPLTHSVTVARLRLGRGEGFSLLAPHGPSAPRLGGEEGLWGRQCDAFFAAASAQYIERNV